MVAVGGLLIFVINKLFRGCIECRCHLPSGVVANCGWCQKNVALYDV
ncbi:hypothetical protein GSU3490 [Geobacter sulfurreducens PCA]|uniref:Uncharacterized protein n=1 Tax=Geobacter sulfurreducens (strain ATCC 51573 / DSM 12127 / PCA) TaxID=243231 RepID=I7EP12_GEOSL|nr:hypothetical protein GSU3490 [Geobacter sulfurreducens PCA]HBB68630.1 hypothetical protein [Geobacter sulfurreducens]HCD96443.1 hypothetical protein [Geobacter sulfurreducens]